MSEVIEATSVTTPARKKPGPKPNSRSRTTKARRLIMQGNLSPKQIATRVGITTSHVYVLRSNMRAEGIAVPPVSDAVKTKPLPSGKPKKTLSAPTPTPTPAPEMPVLLDEPRSVEPRSVEPKAGPIRRFFAWMFSV